MAESRIGYDEILQARVDQLKLIGERLERILIDDTNKHSTCPDRVFGIRIRIRDVMNDLADMIRKAEEEHTAF